MKKLLLLFYLFIGFHSSSQNLVLNPSFENFSTCPFIRGAFHLNVTNWLVPNNSTVDYFNSCSPKLNFSNMFGEQSPKTGQGYVGFFTYSSKNYREYLMGQTNSSLVRGKKYKVSFYVSLSDKSLYSITQIGVLFSKIKETNINNSKVINAEKIAKKSSNLNYIKIKDKASLSNKTEWSKIEFVYEAKGFERFFTIGNFENNKNTELEKFDGSKTLKYAYYYIDEVSIEALEKESLNLVVETPKKTITKTPTIKTNEVYTFKNVLFDFDKAELLAVSIEELNELYKYLIENSSLNIEIYGHTDNVGLNTRNKELSTQRAKAVADYLISLGINTNRISSFGFGSSKPLTTNQTEKGRQKNRRVEFKLIK